MYNLSRVKKGDSKKEKQTTKVIKSSTIHYKLSLPKSARTKKKGRRVNERERILSENKAISVSCAAAAVDAYQFVGSVIVYTHHTHITHPVPFASSIQHP